MDAAWLSAPGAIIGTAAHMAPGQATGGKVDARSDTGVLTVLQRARSWARTLRRDVVAIWIAARDPRVPWYAKGVAAVVAAYALSPIDLIPDFIPVLGYLDDVLIVPAGIWLTVRLIPAELMVEFRAEAGRRDGRPTSPVGAAAIVVLWLSAFAVTVCWVYRSLT